MKKIVLFFSLFFSFLGLSNAQELLIICEPGYRVYIDGEFKGFTSEEMDGIYINEISEGMHLLEFKKGNEFHISYDLSIISGHNEISLNLLEGNYFFRKDGFYVAFYHDFPLQKPLLGGSRNKMDFN
jgi:hypothetical protein